MSLLMGNIVKLKLGMTDNRNMRYEELSSEIGIHETTTKEYLKKYDFIEEKDQACYIPEDKIFKGSNYLKNNVKLWNV